MIEKDLGDEGQIQWANTIATRNPFIQANRYQITIAKFNFTGYDLFLQ